MIDLIQEGRTISIDSSLGKDKLVLTAFSGEEQLSGLFHFELELLSEEAEIAPDQIVGKKVDFYVVPEDQDAEHRPFNGYINRFIYCGEGDRAHIYRATVVPWMWFLKKGSDCREHETGTGSNAQEIIDALLKELGFTDFRWDLKRTPEKRDYCVQYRETHFDFVTRLLAEEGIFYYFKHEEGKHELVMTDHIDGVYDCSDKEVRLLSNLAQPELTDNLTSWNHEYEFTTGKFAHTDYDFENPSSSLMVGTTSLVKLPENSELEYYDFPGRYLKKGLGNDLAKLRIQQEESGHDTVTGSSHCRGFSPGARFEMKAHHNEAEQGGKWVLTHVRHESSQGGSYVSGSGQPGKIYSNAFRCIPADKVFRPPHIPKPRVHGLQSAKVVGPPGDEIYTDKFGRVKVQFHWDRVHSSDEKSSFWVRVATPWAGSNWGMVNLPRIGQEVLIEFLDGDPDRPVLTGMMYNNENMPPYTLPANKTQSGIKTRSSTGGSGDNYNEIRFEDKKGEESVTIHAEKDLSQTVENDRTVTVGNNETHKVGFDVMDGGDQTLEVYNDQKVTIGHGSGEGGQKLDIFEDRDVTIENGDDLVKVNTGDQKIEISSGDQATLVSSGDVTLNVATGDHIMSIDAGKSETEAMQSIELKVGQNSIKIDQAGITIKGIQIKVEGTATVGIKAPKTDVNADAMLTLMGAMTKIN